MSMAHQQVPAEASFPVKTRTAVTLKSGISVVVHSYSNRYFVIISEAGSQSVGTIIQVVTHQQKESGGCDFDVGLPSTVYDISVQFGSETPELLLAARVLASKVSFDKPVLFGLAIRKFDKEIYSELGGVISELLK